MLVSPFKRQFTVDLFCPLKSEKVKIWTISCKKEKYKGIEFQLTESEGMEISGI